MTDVTPALLDGADLLTSDVSEVHSPYDDALVGVVPACTTDDLDRAVAVALERHHAGPPPAHERAAILDRAAALLLERLDEFARVDRPRVRQADHHRPGRGRTRRGHHPLRRRGRPDLHRRDGRHGRQLGRRRQARLRHAGARRGRRGDLAVQLPAQPRLPQDRPCGRGGLPGGAQAGVRDAAHRAAHRSPVRGGRAAAGLAQRDHLRWSRSPTTSSSTPTWP